MASMIKVALIQLHPKPALPEANFTHAQSYLRSAASQGAHLAVLPEYHLTSWAPHDSRFVDGCRQSPKYLEKYRALAKELDMAIVPGTLVEVEDDDEEGTEARAASSSAATIGSSSDYLVNVAYFISRHGEVLGRYQKKNLWHTERPHLTADTATRHTAFDTDLGGGCKVGMLICWDLAFPEAMRELVREGARLVVVPSFWMADETYDRSGKVVNPDSEALFLNSAVVTRACESTAGVIFVNAGGPRLGEGGLDTEGEQPVTESVRYCGVSQVGMPLVGSLGRLGAQEGMSIVEIDPETLDIAEETYKVREDLRKEGWHYGYSFTKEDEAS